MGDEQLRQSLLQLAEAQAIAQVGSWEWDTQTDTVLWSREMYRLCGVKPEEFRANYEAYLAVVHPDDRAAVAATVTRALRDGRSFVSEHRIVHPDGSVRWWQSRGAVLTDERGQALKMFGTGQDITERKHAEEALARYAALIESSDDAIIVSRTGDGTILSWNPGAERLHGYPAAQAQGRPLSLIFPPERADEARLLLERVARGEHIEPYDTVCLRTDGRRVDISVSVSPIKDAKGQVVAASSIARDVTESRRAAEALARSRAQLRDFARRLRAAREQERTLIAREIHDELGQALTALKIDLFSLKNSAPATLPAQLDAKTDAMAELIDGMIDKIRTLAAELRPAVLDNLGLAAAIEWAGRQFSHRTGIRCEVDAAAGSSALDAERSTDVFRILQEALTNVARHAGATRVDVLLRVTPGEVVLEVHDDGRGITAREADDPQAFGLLGMRERALSWGGEVGIGAAPQGGTSVVACLPVPRETGNPEVAA